MQRLGAGENLACLRQLSEKPVTQANGAVSGAEEPGLFNCSVGSGARQAVRIVSPGPHKS